MSISTVRGAAEIYLAKGLAPIPLPPRSKKPVYADWQHLRLTPEVLDAHFPRGKQQNIGVLNGQPSSNALDVDLDCPQAIQAAPFLLPATGWIFGRKSAPKSHWLYRSETALTKASEEFRDVDGKMIVELRSTGSQTVFPPSTHDETGELIEWDSFGEPANVNLPDLLAAVKAVAAAALLAGHWPSKGSLHHARLALSGALTRAGWSEERVTLFVKAVTVAAGNSGIRDAERVGEYSAERLANDEKMWGWTKLSEFVGRDVVDRARQWLVPERVTPAEPPLPEPLPWPDPPAAEAFYGLSGRVVEVIGPASEADAAALLVQTLVAFGNLMGRSGHFRVEADDHYGNEFVVLVGRTSKARKGTSWGQIARLFQAVQEQWMSERVQTGLSSGEGLIHAVRDPITKMERVKERGEPVRYEQVEADPGVSDKRLLVYEPEYANVLKQTERQGNTLSAILRNAWDGRDLRTLTKNSPTRATGACISVIGHITADELRRYLSTTEAANGFGNRHLWLCVDRSKLLPEGGRVAPAALEALQAELVEALAFAQLVGEIQRDAEARAVWCEIYAQLSEGRPGLAGALMARAEAHVMRLALLYALMDRSEVIRAPHLLAALALWDYVERSVIYTFGDSLGDPVADDVLRLLRSCPAGMTRTDLSNYFQRNVTSSRIGAALGLLLQHKLVRRELEDTGGRKAERWFAVQRT